MQRAAAGINVAAAGLNVEEISGDSELLKKQRRDRGRCAVGTIHQHAKLAEVGRADELSQPVGILLAEFGLTRQHLEALAGMFRSGSKLLQVGEDVVFDGVLQLIRE